MLGFTGSAGSGIANRFGRFRQPAKSREDTMRHGRALILLTAAALLLAGCSGRSTQFSGTQQNSVPATLSMTDTPPTGVSPLSFQMTFTGAALNPGNVQLITAPMTVEITRLQTESSLLAAANIAPGKYTSLALTIAPNPSLTFQNNTGAPITVGGSACVDKAICTAGLTTTTDSQSVNFPGSGITLTANSPAALLVDVNLSNMLSNAASTISVDLSVSGAVGVSQITPAQGAPFETLEDVIGVVSAPASGKFQLQTSLGNYNVTTNASTQFLNFTSNVCTSMSFSCMLANEIVSVDMSLQPDNSLLASNIFFEDSVVTSPEIEGVVVATSGLTPPTQFRMVVLRETPANSGPALGSKVNVAPIAVPATTFDVDNLGGGSNIATAGFSFAGAADLIVGQEVQVQQGANSTMTSINASRVRLRSSRLTATVLTTAFPAFTVDGLPPFFQNASPTPITQIVVVTSPLASPNGYTEFGGTATNVSEIGVGKSVSVRGQLFANSGTPTAVATKIIQH
jgi:hypothetical protein